MLQVDHPFSMVTGFHVYMYIQIAQARHPPGSQPMVPSRFQHGPNQVTRQLVACKTPFFINMSSPPNLSLAAHVPLRENPYHMCDTFGTVI